MFGDEDESNNQDGVEDVAHALSAEHKKEDDGK